VGLTSQAPWSTRRANELARDFDRSFAGPSPHGVHPGLVVLASARGTLLSVYALGSLPAQTSAEPLRWLDWAAGLPRLGLAFEELEGQPRVPLADGSPQPLDAADPGLVREVVRVGGRMLPLLHVRSARRVLEERRPRRGSARGG
jgi:hypothetical protein